MDGHYDVHSGEFEDFCCAEPPRLMNIRCLGNLIVAWDGRRRGGGRGVWSLSLFPVSLCIRFLWVCSVVRDSATCSLPANKPFDTPHIFMTFLCSRGCDFRVLLKSDLPLCSASILDIRPNLVDRGGTRSRVFGHLSGRISLTTS